MQFTMGCYKNEHCVICGSHVSEFHNDGCELGAAYADIKDLRIVIKNFLKFLGVETITEGLAKLAAEQSVHLTATPEPVCTCKVTAESYKNCDAHGNRRR